MELMVGVMTATIRYMLITATSDGSSSYAKGQDYNFNVRMVNI